MTNALPNPRAVAPSKSRRPNDTLLQAMGEAAKLSTETLAKRAEIRNPDDQEYVKSEVLVHQMRALNKAGNRTDFNKLARPFTARATAMLRANARGIYEADFEDFLHDVLEQVFTELLSSSEEYTFYEIAFNRAFRFRRLDAYRQWLAGKRAREAGVDEDSTDVTDSAMGTNKPEYLPEHAPEWELDPTRQLKRQEKRDAAMRRMDERGLTDAEKTALMLYEVFEFSIDSDDKGEMTIAKHLGVTGRTVQNLISRARLKLNGKE